MVDGLGLSERSPPSLGRFGPEFDAPRAHDLTCSMPFLAQAHQKSSRPSKAAAKQQQATGPPDADPAFVAGWFGDGGDDDDPLAALAAPPITHDTGDGSQGEAAPAMEQRRTCQSMIFPGSACRPMTAPSHTHTLVASSAIRGPNLHDLNGPCTAGLALPRGHASYPCMPRLTARVPACVVVHRSARIIVVHPQARCRFEPR